MKRLDRLLANTGHFSRREAKELIRAGQVHIDGSPVRDETAKFDDTVLLEVRGVSYSCEPYDYLMLNKPAGLLTATRDTREKTVLDLLPPHSRKRGLFPVGRLDRDTEGLLLLTNHGALAHALLSPKKNIDKTYYVKTEFPPDAADQASLAHGLTLSDGLNCMPAVLSLCKTETCSSFLTIREGKYHQVKRMMAELGKPVVYLKRVRMGPLSLDNTLPLGAFRPLTAKERAELLRLL